MFCLYCIEIYRLFIKYSWMVYVFSRLTKKNLDYNDACA